MKRLAWASICCRGSFARSCAIPAVAARDARGRSVARPAAGQGHRPPLSGPGETHARCRRTRTTSCTRNAASSASGTTADAAAVVALGLHALQHRGQEATGIVSYDGAHFHSHRGLGLVGDNFSDARVIASLPGGRAVGHNRYATTGDTVLRNVQPLYADFEFGGLAVAHNGNLTNATALRRALVRRGCLFQSTTDTEVFIHLIAISLYSTVIDRLIDALKQVIGAYSLIALTNEALIGVRDPLGVRPLILGAAARAAAGCWRARPARSTSSAPSSCATSSRARSS